MQFQSKQYLISTNDNGTVNIRHINNNPQTWIYNVDLSKAISNYLPQINNNEEYTILNNSTIRHNHTSHQIPIDIQSLLKTVSDALPLLFQLHMLYRHRLGELLPRQQSDRPQAILEAVCTFNLAMLWGITPSFDELCPTSRYVPTCY